MTYKTIVAYIDEASRCRNLAQLARKLGERHGARVIGLHVVPDVQIYAAGESMVMADVFEREQKRFTETAAEAHAFFVTAMDGAECEVEWRKIDQAGSTIGERVIENALTADLVVTGQIDPDIESPRRVGVPENVLLHSGRPLLMVPYIELADGLGRHIMIAWRPTADAARAVFDALPLLAKAERVTILEIDSDAPSSVERLTGAEALAASLARHGVIDAKVSRTPSGGIGIAATILSRIADQDADMLIMGGYGHSRFGEYLFGGATREILRQMTVPVLISH